MRTPLLILLALGALPSAARAEPPYCVATVTELASALGIKQRTGQITSDAANAAWLRFERMCHNDLKLLPIDPSTFHKAALMALDATSGLRAGDALHLAVALEAKVKQILTLDTVFERNAKAMKLITVEL